MQLFIVTLSLYDFVEPPTDLVFKSLSPGGRNFSGPCQNLTSNDSES